jgi:hypothetical protein
MSLNWDLTRIADHESVCWVPEYEGSTYRTLNDITEHLIWSTITVGMGEITDANWEEFFTRERMAWHVYGGIKVTPADVRAHIGLRTNVTPITTAKFNASVIKHLRREATDRIKLSTVTLKRDAEVSA